MHTTPSSPRVFDHVLAFALAIGLPLYAKLWVYPDLLRGVERGEAGVRAVTYLTTIVIQWILVAVLAIAWWKLGRDRKSLGLVSPRGWRLILAIALPILAASLMAVQVGGVASQPRLMEQALQQMGDLRHLMPHTPHELRLFMALAVTAGICEEVLYRGFLIGYAARFMPRLAAVVVTSVIFGVGHLYQGVDGAIQTGVVGLVMGLLYLVIGSVWPLMAVHAIVDVGGGIFGNVVVRSAAGP